MVRTGHTEGEDLSKDSKKRWSEPGGCDLWGQLQREELRLARRDRGQMHALRNGVGVTHAAGRQW